MTPDSSGSSDESEESTSSQTNNDDTDDVDGSTEEEGVPGFRQLDGEIIANSKPEKDSNHKEGTEGEAESEGNSN